MPVTALPSASFETTVVGFPTGLTGTVGVRIADGSGGTALARTTAGIVEYPAASGIYSATLTAPPLVGQYQIVWDTGGGSTAWAVDDLTVNPSVPSGYVPDETARASLSAIIAKVRLIIGDPSGGVFTDAEIEAALDDRREEARYVALEEKATITSGGVGEYLTFDAPCGIWETGETLVDASYAVLTPASSDRTNGRWTFATQPLMPVMLSGFTHDMYGASATLLDAWATHEAQSFDVSADGVSLSRSQKTRGLAERADACRAKARARSSEMRRTDEAC